MDEFELKKNIIKAMTNGMIIYSHPNGQAFTKLDTVLTKIEVVSRPSKEEMTKLRLMLGFDDSLDIASLLWHMDISRALESAEHIHDLVCRGEHLPELLMMSLDAIDKKHRELFPEDEVVKVLKDLRIW